MFIDFKYDDYLLGRAVELQVHDFLLELSWKDFFFLLGGRTGNMNRLRVNKMQI